MYPEFNNEEIKDMSAENGVETDTDSTKVEDENQSETDMNSSDAAGEEFENAQEDSEYEAEGEEQNSSSDIPATEDISQESAGEDSVVYPAGVSKSENYLLYGGTDVPEGINYKDTLAFITQQLKYDGGELRQARQNKDGSGIITPEENATEFCSYCGLPISGVDYYRLPDGRKRCPNCNRSLVKSLEDLNSIFNDVVLNMELFFGVTLDVSVSVEMLEERKLKRKIGKGLGNPPKNTLILGVAVEKKGKYTIYLENGIPRVSLIATIAHELTHIWQYTHWNSKNIKKKYGSKLRLVVYEGLAMWAEIQYLYHIGEQTIAKRNEILTLARKDEYGIGFNLYTEQYPLKKETKAFVQTPFSAGESPLDVGN